MEEYADSGKLSSKFDLWSYQKFILPPKTLPLGQYELYKKEFD
jgi:hypothetical protein